MLGIPAHARSNSTAKVLADSLDNVEFADGEIRNGFSLIQHIVTTGLYFDNPKNVFRYDLVENETGLTVKTWTDPVLAYTEARLYTRQIVEMLEFGTLLFKVMAMGVTVRYEVESDGVLIGAWKTIEEARKYNTVNREVSGQQVRKCYAEISGHFIDLLRPWN